MEKLKIKEIFAENLKYYMSYYNKDRIKMSQDLKIPYTTLTDWYNGVTYPRINKIELIADYFNIKISNLIEKRNENKNDTVDESAMFIEKFKKLNANDQELITKIIETLYKQNKNK